MKLRAKRTSPRPPRFWSLNTENTERLRDLCVRSFPDHREHGEEEISASRRIMHFMGEQALLATKVVTEEPGDVQLSERDGLRVLGLLENPPALNSKPLAAARALPKRA